MLDIWGVGGVFHSFHNDFCWTSWHSWKQAVFRDAVPISFQLYHQSLSSNHDGFSLSIHPHESCTQPQHHAKTKHQGSCTYSIRNRGRTVHFINIQILVNEGQKNYLKLSLGCITISVGTKERNCFLEFRRDEGEGIISHSLSTHEQS